MFIGIRNWNIELILDFQHVHNLTCKKSKIKRKIIFRKIKIRNRMFIEKSENKS